MAALAAALCLVRFVGTDVDAAQRHNPGSGLSGMVYVRGGSFRMGTDKGGPAERPVHEVALTGFWMDKTEVTNAEFERFVQATSYKTEAERLGWSGVFDVASGEWKPVSSASWRHPTGPASDIKRRMEYPAVHVSWNDAADYARWAGKRLPTEAEFEYAARGGLEGSDFPWGNELTPKGRFKANTWQGFFPAADSGKDGFKGLAPVGSFDPSPFGIHDLAGNVWEWCADWYADDYYANAPKRDPRGPVKGEERVLRGGSWMCSVNYCQGYRPAARNKSAPDSGLDNTGFRCVKDGPAPK